MCFLTYSPHDFWEYGIPAFDEEIQIVKRKIKGSVHMLYGKCKVQDTLEPVSIQGGDTDDTFILFIL